MPITQTLQDLIDLANQHESPTRFGVREAKLTKTVADGVAVAAAYTPDAPSDWSGDPTTIQEAIDRLAAAVSGLLAGPIP